MATEKVGEVLKEQLEVLHSALNIGIKQVERLAAEQNAKKYDELTLEKKKERLKTEGAYLYLRNFWEVYGFLLKKIKEEDMTEIHFYLPYLRTLTEIYAEFLYFLHQDPHGMVGVFVGNYLIYYSDHYRFVSPVPAFEQEYTRYLGAVKDVINSEGVTFPSDISALSFGALKQSGFAFPSYEEIFKQPYFAAVSSESFAPWSKDTSANFYDKYYRTHSTYAHRGFVNQASVNVGTEAFWLTQFLFLIAQLSVELTNKKLFSYAFKPDFDAFCADMSKVMPDMYKKWDERRPNPNIAQPA